MEGADNTIRKKGHVWKGQTKLGVALAARTEISTKGHVKRSKKYSFLTCGRKLQKLHLCFVILPVDGRVTPNALQGLLTNPGELRGQDVIATEVCVKLGKGDF